MRRGESSGWPGRGRRPAPAIAAGVLLALAIGVAPSAAGGATYKVVPGKTNLVVHLLKEGIGSAFAHDHVVRATKLSGTLEVDPARPDRSTISLEVDARALEVDAPALRKQYGMKPLDADDRREVARHMHGEGQLHTRRYPTIQFRSGTVTPRGRGRFAVRGTLTVRGVSRPVALEVKARLSADGARLKGSGQLKLKQSQFGYDPYSAGWGAVKVKDRATLNIYLEARRAGPGQ